MPIAPGARLTSVPLTPDARAYAYTYIRHLSNLYLVEGLK